MLLVGVGDTVAVDVTSEVIVIDEVAVIAGEVVVIDGVGLDEAVSFLSTK